MPKIIVAGDYRNLGIRYLPPNENNLMYWGMYGKDTDFTTKNHKDGSKITAIGTPVYPSANYATFRGANNYLRTNVIQVPNMTFLCVFRVDTEVGVDLISNYASPGQGGVPSGSVRGCGLELQTAPVGDNKLNIIVNGSVNVGGTDQPAPSTIIGSYTVGTWCCIAGTVNSSTGERKIYNLTAGTSQAQTNANPISLGSAALQIGSKFSGTTPPSTNDVSICLAAIWSDVKTPVELQSVYNYIKPQLTELGITI